MYPLKSNFSVIAPRFSGGISTISSALIIFIIFQSRSKLSTIYHRIMIGMSFADILASLAMGLTTLPMPSSLPPEFPDYGYGGSKLGNTQTCTAQGFLFSFGTFTMFAYNLTLYFYNTCAIGFRMREATIVKYVEPFIHLIPFSAGLAFAIPPLISGQYQPNGSKMWCAFSQTGDQQLSEPTFRPEGVILAISFFSIISLCSFFMVCRVFDIEQQMSQLPRDSTDYQRAARSHQNTKVLMLQVALYVLTFASTLSFPVLMRRLPYNSLIFYLAQVFIPLQGFFNALIFIYHKIYNYRRVHDVSRLRVLKLLLAGDSEEIALFSRISMINYDQSRRVMDMELQDEHGSVEILSISNRSESVAGGFVGSTCIDNQQDLSGFSSSCDPEQTLADLPATHHHNGSVNNSDASSITGVHSISN